MVEEVDVEEVEDVDEVDDVLEVLPEQIKETPELHISEIPLFIQHSIDGKIGSPKHVAVYDGSEQLAATPLVQNAFPLTQDMSEDAKAYCVLLKFL